MILRSVAWEFDLDEVAHPVAGRRLGRHGFIDAGRGLLEHFFLPEEGSNTEVLLSLQHRVLIFQTLRNREERQLTRLSSLIGFKNPSEISSLLRKVLCKSKTNFLGLDRIALRHLHRNFTRLRVIRVVESGSGSLAPADAAVPRGHGGDNVRKVGGEGMLCVRSDKEMFFALKFIIVKSGPVEHHELVIRRYDNEFWDLS